MEQRIRPTLHGSQLRGARLSLEEKAALAAACGYPGLDLTLGEVRAAGGPAAAREVLARYGVVPATVGGVFTARLTDPAAEFEAALAAVTPNAREAAALGGLRTGTVLPGRTDEPKERLWPVVVERLRRLDAALDGTGVRLGVEFIGVRTLRLERPHPFVQSMVEANRLLDEAGVRHVGLTLDSYHWYAAGDTLETIRRTPAERIVILHVNDARALPRDQLLDQDRLVPGEGVIPLIDWLRAISETGFEGFLAMEVLGPRLAGLAPQECARLGMDALSRLLAAGG